MFLFLWQTVYRWIKALKSTAYLIESHLSKGEKKGIERSWPSDLEFICFCTHTTLLQWANPGRKHWDQVVFWVEHIQTLFQNLWLKLMQARMTLWNLSYKIFLLGHACYEGISQSSKQKSRKISCNDNTKNLFKLHNICLVILLLCDGKQNREKKLSIWDHHWITYNSSPHHHLYFHLYESINL